MADFTFYVGIVVLLYLTICLILYFKQESFIFYPVKLSPNYKFSQFKNIEELYFPGKEANIHVLHFKTSNPKGVVLYFHGNAGALNKWGYEAVDFTKRGYDVWMQDYRGYGKSTGKRSEKAFYEDAVMLYEKLREKFDPSRIVIYGRSLGTGIATELATRVTAKIVILETPYASIDAVARKGLFLFFLPVATLLKFHFYNEKKMERLQCPVHIFHGTQDELIPYDQAVLLSKLYGDENILTTIPNGTHNNLPGFELFQRKLDELLK